MHVVAIYMYMYIDSFWHVHNMCSACAWHVQRVAMQCSLPGNYAPTQPKIIGLDSIPTAVRYRIEDKEELESST